LFFRDDKSRRWQDGGIGSAGPYYVSAIDAGHTFLMAGPYELHGAALADVDRALHIACERDGRAWFMAWGTVRIEGSECVGKLNELGLM
jgi:hypothetical protein